MKVLGKDEFITKFETFLVIKKELEYSRNIDKHLYNKYLINKDDNFKEIYEKYFMKLISDKILYKSIHKYIMDTCPHVIPKNIYHKNDNESKDIIQDISNKIVQFFKNIDIYDFDKKEKIQMIDIHCVNIVDLYVIMNYADKKCEEYKIEQILNMLKDVHITNNNS
ncbi:hypothetical protein PFAG_05099 [Plasmodium falciparum Santa Lucia]|uniref:DNA-directed RNA polymerase II subunit RPB4, putative n=11 Tax=Plasmodium falciparum TaxID=5833 RepID=Q8IM54_PLAF7|nr:DNA-directed RNA polymerase II subunit RPB4, putative [Plasmodium falciparum 3D7]ETW16396.1 hypothetical protein PFFVO_04653 [Plasmodium falciparum Vietnam Oak-Knoll (FVO)]ETW34303.1 hypothetical protein PFTANZ_04983 [Plasmodium falciparum Tanzania (2000708)]ETW40400.1 hypothetical protein PFNF135_05227 [Plasmodium falciparum NF135/5.C10]ETW45902.1 hypothetical protein PFMALIP_06033 [Plasmodium falciparum MaliPS096_E11]ETW59118.1 hypothetical protein PFMC_04999 [Plasmodium falciparum CAMP/M|eukprot:XP_001348210.1 DNA-directed RNA polymerase II subunit RPB4,putative [Plasmodium falciparum 3D7]